MAGRIKACNGPPCLVSLSYRITLCCRRPRHATLLSLSGVWPLRSVVGIALAGWYALLGIRGVDLKVLRRWGVCAVGRVEREVRGKRASGAWIGWLWEIEASCCGLVDPCLFLVALSMDQQEDCALFCKPELGLGLGLGLARLSLESPRCMLLVSIGIVDKRAADEGAVCIQLNPFSAMSYRGFCCRHGVLVG